jgi:BASS family bile acid:Na+ symporter
VSDIAIEFSTTDLWLVNIAIAMMMFGVAMGMTVDDFRRVRDIPRAPIAGLVAQFVVLPAVTSLAVWAFSVPPELGLGMILVASCPGGAYSNVATWLARGSVAVSVTMTAISSVAATVLTPFNFALWGGLNPRTSPILREIAVSPLEVLALVVVVLAVPIAAGMLVRRRAPAFADHSERPARIITLVAFLAIVVLAFSRNLALFFDTWDTLVPIVVAHNALALAIGFGMATALRLADPDRRAVTIEVGIQNSGLGLALAFTFLPQLGDVILITAMWGVWHLVAGIAVALAWARRDPVPVPA